MLQASVVPLPLQCSQSAPSPLTRVTGSGPPDGETETLCVPGSSGITNAS